MTMPTEQIIEIIKNRINTAIEDIREAQSEMQYERAKGAKFELEELLSEITK